MRGLDWMSVHVFLKNIYQTKIIIGRLRLSIELQNSHPIDSLAPAFLSKRKEAQEHSMTSPLIRTILLTSDLAQLRANAQCVVEQSTKLPDSNSTQPLGSIPSSRYTGCSPIQVPLCGVLPLCRTATGIFFSIPQSVLGLVGGQDSI